jgi:hypothetical protein
MSVTPLNWHLSAMYYPRSMLMLHITSTHALSSMYSFCARVAHIIEPYYEFCHFDMVFVSISVFPVVTTYKKVSSFEMFTNQHYKLGLNVEIYLHTTHNRFEYVKYWANHHLIAQLSWTIYLCAWPNYLLCWSD